jgi:hypothetical protein
MQMLGYCPVVVLLKVTVTPTHCLSSEKMKDRLAAVSLAYKSADIVAQGLVLVALVLSNSCAAMNGCRGFCHENLARGSSICRIT